MILLIIYINIMRIIQNKLKNKLNKIDLKNYFLLIVSKI